MPAHSLIYKSVNRPLGRALDEYQMIADNDRILVAVSGGKDSVTLLKLLSDRLCYAPVKYTLFPVYVDAGFTPSIAEPLQKMITDITGQSLRVEKTDFGPQAHQRKNPCFTCSRLRRKRFFEVADELNCRTIALGHNRDDWVETLLINMLYAGEISTMLPVQPFFKGRFTVIRPLCYALSHRIREFAKEAGFQPLPNACPSSHDSRRGDIRDMLEALYRKNPKIRGNLFHAMHNVRNDYLPTPLSTEG